ncbi:hypothetical protein DPMN_180421 [Dreissena polymorpha]|uniref:Uncharacterized protein n=1 Tax=Dreissena polymorpha TaxID=45954 RepID=A0A9D4IN86_DREPO|nr:hypothetical protein DPMN_180421 [Dreissena polymorpha]
MHCATSSTTITTTTTAAAVVVVAAVTSTTTTTTTTTTITSTTTVHNDAHAKTRNVIERAIGVLKRRFHVLHGEGEREAFPEEEDPQLSPLVKLDGNHDGQAIRDAITANYFKFENN